jgi:ribosomal protein S18 acetylase RimI-like enzyme
MSGRKEPDMEIFPLTREHRKSLIALYRMVTKDLRRKGIDQWDWVYPNRFTIGGDIKKGTAYGIVVQGRVLGAVAVNREQLTKASGPAWTDHAGAAWSIHRLAVLPDKQGQGLGGRLLRFGEAFIREAGGTSIRLEVYSGNPGALSMYQRAGYGQVGESRYPFRKLSYRCYEKVIVNARNGEREGRSD